MFSGIKVVSAYRRCIVIGLILLGSCETACADDSTFVVAGYLPSYRVANWSREAGPVTDVILFGMPAPANGVFDPSALSKEHIAVVRDVKKKSKCRLLFTVGGWQKSEGFAILVKDGKRRRKFIRDAKEFCIRNSFDGIDYDWEHPEGGEQINSFGQLLAETQAEFAKHDLMVSVAQAGWQNLGTKAYQSVDRVHLMAYDHNFPQATFEKAQADVKQLENAGCPRKKIILGLPFYGRNEVGEAKTFAQLSASSTFQPEESVVDGFAFNGPMLVARKVRFAKEQGLGGVMIWELGQDARGSQSLLKAIGNSLQPRPAENDKQE